MSASFAAECAARVEAYKRQCEIERQEWAKANRASIKAVRDKLLVIGGKQISPQPCAAMVRQCASAAIRLLNNFHG
ncbi:MAG TPA: hypothetical protein VHS80_08210 [Chthoniobacterales bacterium]|nr:hypothetical protein [Chthoniobacterales bacterium]